MGTEEKLDVHLQLNFWSALTCQRFGSVATCRGQFFPEVI
jgi:hypothetical protein